MTDILHYQLTDFITTYGVRIASLKVFFQVFGQPLGTAPVVVVNHAFTGNSQVTGENGWWKEAIGDGKVIDTLRYTVVAFNIPGNGFGTTEYQMITNYQHWAAADVARIFNEGLTAFGAHRSLCAGRMFVGWRNRLGDGRLSSYPFQRIGHSSCRLEGY